MKIGRYTINDKYQIGNIPRLEDSKLVLSTYDPFESETVPFWLVSVESYQTLNEANREFIMNSVVRTGTSEEDKKNAKNDMITRVYFTFVFAESTQKFLDSEMTELVFLNKKEALTFQEIFLSLQEQNVAGVIDQVQKSIDIDNGALDQK